MAAMGEQKPALVRSNSPLSHPAFASRFPKAAEEAEALSRQVSETMSRQVSTESTASAPPNEILSGPCAVHAGWLNFAAPVQVDHVELLREAVEVEDWGKAFAEGRAQCHAKASWNASRERCNFLQMLCGVHKAKTVLEIGSFCGTGALAMALALPQDGSLVALEFDPYFVEFSQRYRTQCAAGQKIKTMIGPALDSLATLAEEVKKGSRAPFDLAVIDADKSHMKQYFDFIVENGLVAESPVICVDTTPFKGQIPLRYQRSGLADKISAVNSGKEYIRAFAKAVKGSQDFVAHECGGMVVIQKPSF